MVPVAHHRHRRLELRHHRRLDNLVLLGARTAGAIKVHMVPAALEKLGRQFQADAVADLATGHEKRVQTRGERILQYLAVGNQRPLGARGAALGYQGDVLAFDRGHIVKKRTFVLTNR